MEQAAVLDAPADNTVVHYSPLFRFRMNPGGLYRYWPYSPGRMHGYTRLINSATSLRRILRLPGGGGGGGSEPIESIGSAVDFHN